MVNHLIIDSVQEALKTTFKPSKNFTGILTNLFKAFHGDIDTYIETKAMKIQVTPKQLLMLLKQDLLKEHPITISGESAKLLSRYMRQNNIKL